MEYEIKDDGKSCAWKEKGGSKVCLHEERSTCGLVKCSAGTDWYSCSSPDVG